MGHGDPHVDDDSDGIPDVSIWDAVPVLLLLVALTGCIVLALAMVGRL